MIDKVDLVMWTKNGFQTLPLVLKRINEVIPDEFVNNRIVVDDRSTDDTREIAKSSGWQVIVNEGKGISDAANTALKHVASHYFMSFEQDLLLSYRWWQRIPKHLSEPKVAIASGVRLPSQPLALRKLEEYAMERCQKRKERMGCFFYGKTLDNTIYKTEIIRRLGGFPKLPISAGVDSVLAQRIHLDKYEWMVDYTVKSTHLRRELREDINHRYWYGTCLSQLEPILFNRPVNLKGLIREVFFSPIFGFRIAVKKNVPQIVYIYPLLRFNVLKGALNGMKYTFQRINK